MQRGSDNLSGHPMVGIPTLISRPLVQGTAHCPQETTYHVSFPLNTNNCLSLLLPNIPHLLPLPLFPSPKNVSAWAESISQPKPDSILIQHLEPIQPAPLLWTEVGRIREVVYLIRGRLVHACP